MSGRWVRIGPPVAAEGRQDLLDELEAELKRIAQINTDEDRPRTVPELTVWMWLQKAKLARATPRAGEGPAALHALAPRLDLLILNARSIAKDQREHGGKCGPVIADLLDALCAALLPRGTPQAEGK